MDNISNKLFQIRNEIQKHPKIKPEGRNDFHKFNYLKPSQVLEIVNPLLEKYKLLIEFNITDVKSFPAKTSTSKTENKEGISVTTKTEADTFDFLAVVNILSTDIDTGVIDELTVNIPMDKFSPQGYGSILTYVERYYYMKTFGIATNDDDPDTQEQRKRTERPKI